MHPTNYKKQLAQIHCGKKALGLSDENYRAFLFGLTGKSSSKAMTQAQRLFVIAQMRNKGAFRKKNIQLTGQQRACVAKWHKLRSLGEVADKDKKGLEKFIDKRFGEKLHRLSPKQTNQLLGQLEGWIQKVEHTAKQPNQSIIDGYKNG